MFGLWWDSLHIRQPDGCLPVGFESYQALIVHANLAEFIRSIPRMILLMDTAPLLPSRLKTVIIATQVNIVIVACSAWGGDLFKRDIGVTCLEITSPGIV